MDTFEQAKAFFLQGIRHYEAGRFEQARQQFEASLSLVPQRASTLTNLGATRLKLGRFSDAAVVLEEATQIDPADAQAWGHRATALAELGERAQALHCADEALARNDKLAAIWTLRGTLLREAGRMADARESFERAIEHGADANLNRFFIAAIEGVPGTDATPRAYVQALFDGYAQGFDEHLVRVLRYDAPQVLVQGLGPRTFGSALDLGRGTGLVGVQLRGRAKRITGVDLSANMVQQARARSVYEEVVQADIAEWLRETTATFDLVVAADVFIYVGRVDDVFAQVQRVLAPGGVFCFTVELAAPGEGVVLRPSLRHAHSRDSIESLAHSNGFRVLDMVECPVRWEQRTPIAGLFAWLEKP